MLIITLAEIIWAPFKNVVNTVHKHGYLRSSVPILLSKYRNTPFTLRDGFSEWKGNGGLLFATKGENLIGSFYEPELQLVDFKGKLFVIDKILKTKTVKDKKEYFVSWKDYSSDFNSWVSEKNLNLK